MRKNILNMEEFLLEARTSAEEVIELKRKISKRQDQISRTNDWKKKRKLELRNKIDYYKIKIENYKNFINKQLS